MSLPTPWIIGFVSAAGLLACAHLRAAEMETYALDPVHTRVVFAIDHAGFSKAVGTVSGSTGTLRFDPDDWTTAALEAQVPLARLDLGDDKWNRATLAGNLLDADAHPVATFVSTRVEPVAGDRARVYGMLGLRGVEREVVLEVVLNARKRHPLPPFRRTVGFSATTTISRADFGMTAWKSVIGDAIELRIEAEATRTRDDGGNDTPDAAAPEARAEDMPAATPVDEALPADASEPPAESPAANAPMTPALPEPEHEQEAEPEPEPTP